MKILILNDGSKYENWGIRACYDGLINIFDNIFSDYDLDGIPHSVLHRKYVFEPKFKGYKIFSEESVFHKKFGVEIHPVPPIADLMEFFLKKWTINPSKYQISILSSIKSADCIVFNAEGSTYRNNYASMKCLFLLWIAKTVYHKKTYFVNGSITLAEVDDRLTGFLRRVFRDIDGVIVREKKSLVAIRGLVCPSKCLALPDSVFTLNFEHSATDSTFIKSRTVAFSASMLPMDFRSNPENSEITKILQHCNAKGFKIAVLAKDIEDQDAKILLKYVEGELIGADYSYVEVAQFLNHCCILISGRYHHLIFSLMVGTPVIPLNTTSHKISGLINWFYPSRKVYDPTNLASEYKDLLTEVDSLLVCSGKENINLNEIQANIYSGYKKIFCK